MVFINDKSAIGYVYKLKETPFDQWASLSIEKEELLFSTAKESCLNDLYLIEEKTSGPIRDILKTHRMFIDDPKVTEETINLIQKGYSRGYSYRFIVNKYIVQLKNNPHAYMASRSDDLEDIKMRMLHKMYESEMKLSFNRDTILCTEVVLPSMVINATNQIKGFISKEGSYLSHAAILAKEKGLSFVVSKQEYNNDDFVIIDGKNKVIYLNPSEEKTKEFETKIYKDTHEKAPYNLEEIKVFINVSNPLKLDIENHLKYVEGIGLFRTEHIVLGREIYPTFNDQLEIYKMALKSVYPKKVRIRLFDFTGDKTPYFLKQDPIREFEYYGPLHKMYFEQLEALLFANETYGNLEILIPMIRDVKEYYHVVEAIQLIRKNKGLSKKTVRVGIMLETLEAFEELTSYKEVSFINVGSNDLSSELIGIDRHKITDYQLYAEAMIEPLKTISKFCKRHGVDYVLCGDLVSRKESLKRLLKAQEKSISIPESFLKEALKIITHYNNEKK